MITANHLKRSVSANLAAIAVFAGTLAAACAAEAPCERHGPDGACASPVNALESLFKQQLVPREFRPEPWLPGSEPWQNSAESLCDRRYGGFDRNAGLSSPTGLSIYLQQQDPVCTYR
ncbi:hypothetical protein [Rhodoligotrophos defluvii]|uniref:hypothetical protein n=1 Tax=Rhodoligotrophos defluvii TaxID=2561934 RepID=UPI0010C94AF2|nr:hypothetical protein [Rhodoligotrophos defluvii]